LPAAGRPALGILLHDSAGLDLVVRPLVLFDAKREIALGEGRRRLIDGAPDERWHLDFASPQRHPHRYAEKHQEREPEGAHQDKELAQAPHARMKRSQ
jgi:hypothetical protein